MLLVTGLALAFATSPIHRPLFSSRASFSRLPRSVTACDNPEKSSDDAKRTLNTQFFAIALPALAQFAAEPIAGLVDTAYLGRLGASALGGAGVAISAHYATAKLFNDPLLRTSISIVASGDGAARSSKSGAEARTQAISAALVLALAVGLMQTIFFLLCAPAMVSAMGAPVGSSMRPVALSYLRVRSLGMPTATMWLVSNGIFRGLGDTRTPLAWALLFSALNAILDPIFIFTFGLGAAGAAAGTALSQSVALVGLLRVLEKRTGVRVTPLKWLSPASLRELAPALLAYGRAGVLVFFRTCGKVIAYTYCSRAAAGLGAVASAAHLLCFNLGVVLSQLCESIAVATQTLLARAMGTLLAASASGEAPDAQVRADSRRDAWHVIRLGSAVGAVIAGSLTALTALRPARVIASLTTDIAVREACGSIVVPVLACQLFKGLAFPSNGVVMGGLDWEFATFGVWAGSALCIGLVHARSPPTLLTIWIGLSAFMASQTLFSALRVASRKGPWAMLFERD
jgi:putative MATE family efflux protein